MNDDDGYRRSGSADNSSYHKKSEFFNKSDYTKTGKSAAVKAANGTLAAVRKTREVAGKIKQFDEDMASDRNAGAKAADATTKAAKSAANKTKHAGEYMLRNKRSKKRKKEEKQAVLDAEKKTKKAAADTFYSRASDTAANNMAAASSLSSVTHAPPSQIQARNLSVKSAAAKSTGKTPGKSRFIEEVKKIWREPESIFAGSFFKKLLIYIGGFIVIFFIVNICMIFGMFSGGEIGTYDANGITGTANAVLTSFNKQVSDAAAAAGLTDYDQLAYDKTDWKSVLAIYIAKNGSGTTDISLFKTAFNSVYSYAVTADGTRIAVTERSFADAQTAAELTSEQKSKAVSLAEKDSAQLMTLVNSNTAKVKAYAYHTNINKKAASTYPDYVYNGAPFTAPIVGWNSKVSSEYGTSRTSSDGSTHGHAGIDITAAKGTPIYSVADGYVIDAAYDKSGYGYHVAIYHGSGIITHYAHCSKLLVTVGQTVTARQNIALVGSTGNSTGPHCHFEVIINGQPYNPRAYLPV